jgi:N-acetylglucosamine-6-phosphate deacetylase
MMDRAVRNAGTLVGAARAVEMATSTPARAVGVEAYATQGVGGRADVVALDRTTLEVRAVWLAGEAAYAPA